MNLCSRRVLGFVLLGHDAALYPGAIIGLQFTHYLAKASSDTFTLPDFAREHINLIKYLRKGATANAAYDWRFLMKCKCPVLYFLLHGLDTFGPGFHPEPFTRLLELFRTLARGEECTQQCNCFTFLDLNIGIWIS